ncbi:hypothetical protein OZX72_03005 [Bifidobacterium sp. ESL0769]|uniref:hypothetical protein n=1 Tax=Bifidobacterium sp. ESL0769 TaxID=2983229 RepID=UPI0023F7407E|nr:hypothetical protein [Bifidobacterium sp. ESL0769]WEV67966.1 hypothetical protein OZX72_03005 [Bifidobacterium sp. ESL0769]
MNDEETKNEKPLVDELASQANEHDAGDRPALLKRIRQAVEYLKPVTKGYDVPPAVMDDCIVSVALDLWQSKDARNGLVGLDNDAGIEPFHVSSDPLRTARPKLRAVGVPAGMGIA